MKKIYFAGSIRGGREKAEDYKKIVDILKKDAIILDEHVSNPKLSSTGEKISNEEIYKRDTNWLKECDLLIAEVTNPSLGVGYEIGYAGSLNKKIVCLYEESANLSGMISGNPSIILIPYDKIENLESKLKEYIK